MKIINKILAVIVFAQILISFTSHADVLEPSGRVEYEEIYSNGGKGAFFCEVSLVVNNPKYKISSHMEVWDDYGHQWIPYETRYYSTDLGFSAWYTKLLPSQGKIVSNPNAYRTGYAAIFEGTGANRHEIPIFGVGRKQVTGGLSEGRDFYQYLLNSFCGAF
jgi:hypothetical protein